MGVGCVKPRCAMREPVTTTGVRMLEPSSALAAASIDGFGFGGGVLGVSHRCAGHQRAGAEGGEVDELQLSGERMLESPAGALLERRLSWVVEAERADGAGASRLPGGCNLGEDSAIPFCKNSGSNGPAT